VGYLPQEIGPEAGGKMLFEVVADSQPELARLSAQLRELQARLDDPRTAADARLMARTLDADGEVQSRFEALGGYDLEANVEAALRYFGFGPADFDRPLESLSGGERKFVHLARLLLQTPDLLLLDEPDNHLDLQAKAWLEAFIRDYPGAVLVISHDRSLLDRVARKILELQDGRLEVYHGNDTAYAAERERRLLRRHELYTV
jgi:ATP-binding cassette subfamily F protein 3